MANATETLGHYIFTANPYRAVAPPPGQAWPVPPVVPAIPAPPPPPPPPPPPGIETLFGLCLDDVELHENPGLWNFRGTGRSVRRAIRIPYMYYTAGANGGQVLVVEHLLIGFEGSGGY